MYYLLPFPIKTTCILMKIVLLLSTDCPQSITIYHGIINSLTNFCTCSGNPVLQNSFACVCMRSTYHSMYNDC